MVGGQLSGHLTHMSKLLHSYSFFTSKLFVNFKKLQMFALFLCLSLKWFQSATRAVGILFIISFISMIISIIIVIIGGRLHLPRD